MSQKRKVRSLRDHATERVQLGLIAALCLTILVFGLLGNTRINVGNIKPLSGDDFVIVDPILDPVDIPKPPEQIPVSEVKVDSDDDNTNIGAVTSDSSAFNPVKIEPVIDTFMPIHKVNIKPYLKTRFDPPYPERMKKLRIEGRVVVLIGIDRAGQVMDVRVEQTSGYPDLDSAAVEEARKAQFSPAIHNGKPVPVKIKLPVNFKLVY